MIGTITILYGAVVFALPVGVIGTTFSQHYERFLAEQRFRQELAARETDLDSEGEDPPGASPVARISSIRCGQEPHGPTPLEPELQSAIRQVSMLTGVPADHVRRWEQRLAGV